MSKNLPIQTLPGWGGVGGGGQIIGKNPSFPIRFLPGMDQYSTGEKKDTRSPEIT